jgi:Rrf2 family nitric oxide-sensitive transcriptional repressor
MHFTTYTDYALRVLIYLGLFTDRFVTTQEMGRAYEISHNHLIKIVNSMGQKGLLDVRRGRGGGFRLNHLPSEIRLGAVIQMTEPDMDLLECFKSSDNCTIAPLCQLRERLRSARNSFVDVLNETSIQDLLGSESQQDHLRQELLAKAGK